MLSILLFQYGMYGCIWKISDQGMVDWWLMLSPYNALLWRALNRLNHQLVLVPSTARPDRMCYLPSVL